MTVNRKVKIGGKWILAVVPLDKAGRPERDVVLFKGQRIPVDGGTFYLLTGRGKGRKATPCGNDAESARRALAAQAHVLELRRLGMEVDDAPEIRENRRQPSSSLREIARRFKERPPGGLKHRSQAKYRNALESFAEWAAKEGVRDFEDVKRATIERWIQHLKTTLAAKTINAKVTIVRGRLKQLGNEISLERGTMPRTVKRNRKIYSIAQLKAFFRTCSLEEFELFSMYAISGMRNAEVMYFGVSDLDRLRAVLSVTGKPALGFEPKTYEEREISVSFAFIRMQQKRVERLMLNAQDLLYGTRAQQRRGNAGGKPDKNHLEKCKQVAYRGNLNCGHCVGTYRGQKISCKDGPVCRQWTLHKFRHTFATQMLRDKVDIKTVSQQLGHSDLSTTEIYLRALEAEAAQPQAERSSIAQSIEGFMPTRQAGDRRLSRSLGPRKAPPLPKPPADATRPSPAWL